MSILFCFFVLVAIVALVWLAYEVRFQRHRMSLLEEIQQLLAEWGSKQ